MIANVAMLILDLSSTLMISWCSYINDIVPIDLKVNINEGAGYLANNPWACKCEGLRALRQRSIDKQLTCDGLSYESCFAGPRKSSHSAWVTLVVALILLTVFTLILYFVKLTSKGSSSLPDHDPADSPECEIR